MKHRTSVPYFFLSILILTGLLVSCSGTPVIPGVNETTSTPVSSVNTPTPTPTPKPEPPSPYRTADEFLKAWSAKQYDEMYGLISKASQENITQERFVTRYKAITAEATITGVRAQIQPGIDKASPTITYTVDIATDAVGPVHEENTMDLVQDNGDWKVTWEPRLIFKNLWGDSLIHLYPYIPERGTIYDRNGQPLATQDQVYSVGVVPGQVKDDQLVINTLSEVLKMDPAKVKEKYTTNAQPGWFMPVGDLPLGTSQDVIDRLEAIDGVMTQRKSFRSYPNGTAAAQVIGYMSQVNADDLKRLGTTDYSEGDMIGKAGLEGWGEKYLAGQRGAKLAIISPEGTIQQVIAERPGKPAQDVYTTIDLNIQKAAESALGDQRGTVVVLSPKDGSILAIANHPAYDPNDFVKGMPADKWDSIVNDPGKPMNDKAAGGAYPAGSTFKVVTMSAGLEKAGLNKDSAFSCAGRWNGFGGSQWWSCWNTRGHGGISLFQGLVQSCDVVFYEVGKKLDSIDQNLLPDFAKQFGLGKPLGVDGLDEQSGVAPGPEWKKVNYDDLWYSGDTVNLSIGQGFLLVTPLQMTNVYNSIAANGKLYKPYIVQKIAPKDGAPTVENKPTELGPYPVSPANVATIRAALALVTKFPNGTAAGAFNGYPIPISGKTGTAEQGTSKETTPHAWFMSYGPSDDPQITVGVLAEESGEGSAISAPIARRVFEQVLK